MNSKRLSMFLKRTGICIKDMNQIVKFQNKKCKHYCGNLLDEKCEKGCMDKYLRRPNEQSFEEGIVFKKNIKTNKDPMDALILNDGESITTLLIENKTRIKKQLELFKAYRLTKSEMNIIEKILTGLSNQDIASELFLSKSTLKTHMNNIYKKIPLTLKEALLILRK